MTSALGHDLLWPPVLGWTKLLAFSFVVISRLQSHLSSLGPFSEPPLPIP